MGSHDNERAWRAQSYGATHRRASDIRSASTNHFLAEISFALATSRVPPVVVRSSRANGTTRASVLSELEAR